jgi:hypothetical protein
VSGPHSSWDWTALTTDLAIGPGQCLSKAVGFSAWSKGKLESRQRPEMWPTSCSRGLASIVEPRGEPTKGAVRSQPVCCRGNADTPDGHRRRGERRAGLSPFGLLQVIFRGRTCVRCCRGPGLGRIGKGTTPAATLFSRTSTFGRQ